MIRFREFGIEEDRPAALVFVHQGSVLEMGDEGSLPLNSSICQGGNLFAVEFLPPLPVECLCEARFTNVSRCLMKVEDVYVLQEITVQTS